jgi:hypothetical protein
LARFSAVCPLGGRVPYWRCLGNRGGSQAPNAKRRARTYAPPPPAPPRPPTAFPGTPPPHSSQLTAASPPPPWAPLHIGVRQGRAKGRYQNSRATWNPRLRRGAHRNWVGILASEHRRLFWHSRTWLAFPLARPKRSRGDFTGHRCYNDGRYSGNGVPSRNRRPLDVALNAT